MKMKVICDKWDTMAGMRLAGIEGILCDEKTDFNKVLEAAFNDKQIAILLINESLADLHDEEIECLKKTRPIPLIATIPDMNSKSRGKNFISRYIKEASGMSI